MGFMKGHIEKFAESISARNSNPRLPLEQNYIKFNGNYIVAYYKHCLSKWLNNTGKSSPQEFWNFVVLNLIIGNILCWIEKQLNISFILYAYLLFIAIPFINLWIRRLNDISKSKYGLYLPILFILIIVLFSSSLENFWLEIAIAMVPIISLGVHVYWSFLPGKRKL